MSVVTYSAPFDNRKAECPCNKCPHLDRPTWNLISENLAEVSADCEFMKVNDVGKYLHEMLYGDDPD